MTGEIVLRHSGELVDPADPDACLRALAEVEEIQAQAAEAKRALTAALVAYSQQQGERTVTLPGGAQYVREGGPRVEYDAAVVRDGLREACAPPDVVERIVRTTVVVKVDGREAAKAVRANPEYAKAIEAGAVTVDRPFTVRVKR